MTCRTLTLAITIALAATVSCTDSVAPAMLSSDGQAARAIIPGLEQRITITPTELVTGEVVMIQSVLTNRTDRAIAVTSRVCGLDIGGSLKLEPLGPNCAAHSTSGELAPEASRISSDHRRVTSPAGVYTVRVGHALNPAKVVEVRVVVRSR